MSVDFAWIYLPGGAATAVAAGATVPFTQIQNQPANSHITLNAVTGVVTIKDTGFYQVSYGILEITNLANLKPSLRLNGAIQANQQFTGSTNVGTVKALLSMTTIVRITTSGSTLDVFNSGGAGWSLNSTDGATGGVSAFMTIVKLQ